MATSTSSILGLIIPTPGTSEPYSRAVENANLAKLETAIGAKQSRFTTNTYSNSVGESSQFSVSLAAGQNQGAVHRMVIWGTYDNSAGASSITWRCKLGTITISSFVQTTPAVLATVVPWRIEFDLIVTTTGLSGTWRGSMVFGAAPVAADINKTIIPNGSITQDTTVATAMEITAQWANASASNTVRCDAGYYHRISNA